MLNFKNNVISVLAGNISNSATNIIVKDGEGELFGDNFPMRVTLAGTNLEGIVTRREIVEIIARTGDNLEVIRNVEPCIQNDSISPKTHTQTALNFEASDFISIEVTAEYMNRVLVSGRKLIKGNVEKLSEINLNFLETAGLFEIENAINKPTEGSDLAFCEVLKTVNGIIYQKYINQSGDLRTFYRIKNGSWGVWNEIVTDTLNHNINGEITFTNTVEHQDHVTLNESDLIILDSGKITKDENDNFKIQSETGKIINTSTTANLNLNLKGLTNAGQVDLSLGDNKAGLDHNVVASGITSLYGKNGSTKNVVMKWGNDGIAEFAKCPQSPTLPFGVNDLTNKQYVDSKISTSNDVGIIKKQILGNAAKGTPVIMETMPYVAEWSNGAGVGISGNEKYCTALYGSGNIFNSMKIALRKLNSPTGDVKIRIETDNSGVPSGTLVHSSAEVIVVGTTIATSMTEHTITFSSSFTIPYMQKVWIVVGKTGTLGTNPNVYLVGIGVGALILFPSKNLSAGAWEGNGVPMFVQSLGFLPSMISALVGTTVGTTYSRRFLGLAKDDYLDGQIADIVNMGVFGGFSGLQSGRFYQLKAGGGVESTGAPSITNFNHLGMAISETEINLKLN